MKNFPLILTTTLVFFTDIFSSTISTANDEEEQKLRGRMWEKEKGI